MPIDEKFLASYAASSMRRGNPPIAVAHPLIGIVGHVTHEHGFTLARGMSERAFRSLQRAEREQEERRKLARLARRVCTGELGAVSTWNEILSARADAANCDDFYGMKNSVSNNPGPWSCMARITGTPEAASYTSNPGAVMNSTSTGAWPLTVASNKKKYLLGASAQSDATGAGGTNGMILIVDLLVAIGNMSANSVSQQNITTQPALTRYCDGRGVQLICEVTTTLGSGDANIVMNYDGVSGTNKNTASEAMSLAANEYVLQPGTSVSGGRCVRLADGDSGVKKVNSLTLSGAMGSGVLAILLYKPLLFFYIGTADYANEPTTSHIMGGVQELLIEAGGATAFLTFLVLSSATSTGRRHVWINTVNA